MTPGRASTGVRQHVDIASVCQNADMSQEETVGPLEESAGYVLKQAHAALRTAMEAGLRPLELTVPQYACLELLGQHPGLSNAELARGAFVTRQSMNLVLRGLQDRGLLTRPDQAPHGRALPTQLTPAGRDRLHAASVAVRAVERQMLAPLPPANQRRLRDDLAACATALTPTPTTHTAEDRQPFTSGTLREAHRQSAAIAASEQEADDQAFADAISWDWDAERPG